MLKIFLGNFYKFDFLIFALAVLTLFLIFRTRHLVKDVLKTLKPEGYLPAGKVDSDQMKAHYDLYLSPEGEKILQEKQRKTNLSYTLFVNVTSIFPLMGLLGTVISLLPMVKIMGDLDAQTGSFFLALTSTFWGIVFAIIFKGINGLVEAEIDYCNKMTDLYFSRNSLFFKNELSVSADLHQPEKKPAQENTGDKSKEAERPGVNQVNLNLSEDPLGNSEDLY